MDVQQLLAQINHAFGHVALPQVRVAPHHCGECDDIVEALQGRTCESLSQEDTSVFGNAQIHLIAPEAIHYYFPNILAKALDPKEYDFLWNIMYFLSSSDEEYTGSQVSLFDEEQRQAVYQFLCYIQEHTRPEVELSYLDLGHDEELTKALKNWTPSEQPAT